MSHYFIAAMSRFDAQTFAEYQAEAVATIGTRHMTPVAITESVTVEEGELDADVLVLLRFSDEAEFRAWWDSPEYARAKPLRERSAVTRFAVTVPGLD